MVRIQVQLTEEQARAVRAQASAQGTSIAEVVREAVDQHLSSGDRQERWRRAVEAVGRFGSGVSDVSAEHDRYLEEAYGG